MKGKHYNIISHCHLSHTKVANFNHFFFSYFVQMKKIKLNFKTFFQDVHIYKFLRTNYEAI